MCEEQKRKIMHAEIMMLLQIWSLVQNPQRLSSEGRGKMQVNSRMTRKHDPG